MIARAIIVVDRGRYIYIVSVCTAVIIHAATNVVIRLLLKIRSTEAVVVYWVCGIAYSVRDTRAYIAVTPTIGSANASGAETESLRL